jgi:cytochrome c peroxidase
VLGNNTTRYVIPMEDRWADLPDGADPAERARNAFRESVQRGHDVFFFRTFWISDAMHINTVGLGNPIKRTCSTCHGMHMTGMDTANGWMDVGTTNHPWALEPPESPWAEALPELPLFRITCRADLPPHPFLGREIYTQDPGRALISGKCEDVGAIVIQQFRGLAARAPYFSNGSAATLRELVDFYDRRFNIRLTEQERDDLVNFLSVL